MPAELTIPSVDDIRAAKRRIAAWAHVTPVMTSRSLDELAGARLFFKCENLQRAGAFKFRGASNAVLSLTDDEARRGVVTHSSGNHAAALALAASLRGIPAYIVVPEDAPRVKVRAIETFGGRITFCKPTLADREATAQRLMQETGATMVHPYDDARVIAGQGTCALELHEQAPQLDGILVPVSGGGLISGIALASHGARPQAAVIGAEPAEADDAARSLRAGSIQPQASGRTIADGLRASLCPRTFAVIRNHVSDIITVTEPQIIDAMRLIWERLKLIVEPSGAVPLAAILNQRERFAGQRIGIVLSGGNVDLDRLPW